MRKLLEGKLDYSDSRVRDAVFQCAQCEACKTMCPTGIDFVRINQHLRESLAKEGNLLDMQKAVGKILIEKKNPFNEPPSERGAWLGSAYKNPEKADYLYFVSCTASYSANRIAKSVQRIMKVAGIEFAVLGGEEQCCGNPLLRMGEREKFQEIVAQNMAAFDKLGIKTIFTACAGCYKAFMHDYPKKYEILHVVQLMDRLVKEGKLKFKPLPKKIIYYDGCDIGRHCGIYEEPRNVLRAVPQLELIEFDYNREEAVCCGGPLVASYPEIAGQIPMRHVQEAMDKGADVLVSACAACMLNFKEGAKRLNSKIDIQDLCMLLGKQV